MADQPSAFTGIWEAPVVDPSNEFRMTDPWYEAIQRTSARANSGVQGSGTPGGLAKWDTATSLTSAALSGDATTPTNSTVVTLAASGVVAGTYGDATHVSQVTVDVKGRVTAAGDVAITFPPDTGITQLTGDVTAGPGSGSQVATLAASGVAAGTYGDGTHVAQVTFDAKGRATAASSISITNQGTVTHTVGALTANELVVGNGGADLKTVAATDGQIPIGKSSDGSVNLATLTAGANITITNAGGSITIAASGGSTTGGSTLIGLERLLGDGSTTTFNLPDLAEYVVDVSDAGSTVDPTLYTLSSDLSQVTFDTAPTAGHVLTFEYVVAQLAA